MSLVRFEIGKPPYKYVAVLSDGRRVPFGNRNYQHYRDNTGLRYWEHLNHNDRGRRARYIARHSAIRKKDGTRAIDDKTSPAYFSLKYLW